MLFFSESDLSVFANKLREFFPDILKIRFVDNDISINAVISLDCTGKTEHFNSNIAAFAQAHQKKSGILALRKALKKIDCADRYGKFMFFYKNMGSLDKIWDMAKNIAKSMSKTEAGIFRKIMGKIYRRYPAILNVHVVLRDMFCSISCFFTSDLPLGHDILMKYGPDIKMDNKENSIDQIINFVKEHLEMIWAQNSENNQSGSFSPTALAKTDNSPVVRGQYSRSSYLCFDSR